MKQYQDPDPLHGHGKAIPHPKRPTYHTYRGRAFGSPMRLPVVEYRAARTENVARATGRRFMSAGALIAACLGFVRGR